MSNYYQTMERIRACEDILDIPPDTLGGLLLRALDSSYTLSPGTEKRNIELLLKLKPNVNLQNNKKETPLHLTIKQQHTAMDNLFVPLLIKNGADVNIQDDDGNTPLLSACFTQGQYMENTVRVLIEAGADVNKQGSAGFSPLMAVLLVRSGYPISQRHIKCMNMLLEAGANVNAVSEKGYTPLYIALAKIDNPAIIRKLLDKGADVSVGKEWTSPLEGEIKELIDLAKKRKQRINVGLGLGSELKLQTNVKSLIGNFVSGPVQTKDPITAINEKRNKKIESQQNNNNNNNNNINGLVPEFKSLRGGKRHKKTRKTLKRNQRKL